MPTVLVVDDDVPILDLLRDVLDLEDIGAVGVSDPTEVRQIVKREGPEVIVLDLVLGRSCGIEVARDLRNVGVTTPIVALSGDQILADEARSSDLFAAVVEKPFNLDEIFAVLTGILSVGGIAPSRESS